MKLLKVLKLSTAKGIVPCMCCNGRGWYDEGYGREECSACAGTGYED